MSLLVKYYQRIYALILLIVLALFAWIVLVVPILSLWSIDSNKSENRMVVLAKYQQSIQNKPHWESALQQLQEGLYSNMIFHEPSLDLSTAKLQQNVKGITEKASGKINSIQVLPAGIEQNVKRIQVRVSFSIPIQHIGAFMAGIDGATPYIFIDAIDMTSPDIGVIDKDKQMLISVNCDLFAYAHERSP